jgi:tripartite-type tricarboxylate transporter receptor subunit TctC
MKNVLRSLVAGLACISFSAIAAETIVVTSPYGAGHGATASEFKILDAANKNQSKYNFIMEFKPGAQQTLALKAVNAEPQNRLGIIAASIVENTRAGTINAKDYVPVAALGEACWVVVMNVGDQARGLDSLRQVRKTRDELVIGGVAFGNAAHLTGLQIAEKYGFKVRYVPFKSNTEAMIQGMVGDSSVNMVIVQVKDFEAFKPKQDKLQMLASSCPVRIGAAPKVRTLKEQGIAAPYIMNAVVAHVNMDAAKRYEIEKILEQAMRDVGAKSIAEMSDMSPPIFRNLSVKKWYDDSYKLIDTLLDKHATAIENNRNGNPSK